MRVVCVYREGEDYSLMVGEWIAEFGRRTGKEIEVMSPDGRDGVQFCRTYDIVEYPTIMSMWRGKQLPLFDEVSYWA